MTNSLTNLGEQIALMGDDAVTPADGGIARIAKSIRLFQTSSTPNKDGTGFVEVADGNGYTAGGVAITEANWTFSVVSQNGQNQLDDQVFTAVGGNIANIAGAYIADTGGNVLGWWERSVPITLTPGDTLTLDDLTIRLT